MRAKNMSKQLKQFIVKIKVLVNHMKILSSSIIPVRTTLDFVIMKAHCWYRFSDR